MRRRFAATCNEREKPADLAKLSLVPFLFIELVPEFFNGSVVAVHASANAAIVDLDAFLLGGSFDLGLQDELTSVFLDLFIMFLTKPCLGIAFQTLRLDWFHANLARPGFRG